MVLFFILTNVLTTFAVVILRVKVNCYLIVSNSGY